MKALKSNFKMFTFVKSFKMYKFLHLSNFLDHLSLMYYVSGIVYIFKSTWMVAFETLPESYSKLTYR